MSHLRAPAARADRQEGGRHGRPVAHPLPSPSRTRIRSRLLRLAILPSLATALSAGAAVLFAVLSTDLRPTPLLWAVLAGACAVTAAGIVTAALAAGRTARSVAEGLDALRGAAARDEAELPALVEALRRGEAPPVRKRRAEPAAEADEFTLLAAELARAQDSAVAAVVQAARLSSQAGSEQKLAVFGTLAQRLQPLVHQGISILDELERDTECPDLLKDLFRVDHVATRIRRHAENLTMLGGAESRRRWSKPVPMTEVLRSAIAEIDEYERVRLVPPTEGALRGHAVADVSHLVAELVENATVFSAPHTQVLLRASLVTSGLAVEVEDRGPGMPADEQNRVNALLADPDQVNAADLLADGRIGLYVVARLAQRYGIQVQVRTNIYGGVQAVLVVPQGLLGAAAPALSESVTPVAPQGRTAGGTGSLGVPVTTGGQEAETTGTHPVPPLPEEHEPSPPPVRDADCPQQDPVEVTPAILAEATLADDLLGKPLLPRRRAQEYSAPVFEDAPAPRLGPDPDRPRAPYLEPEPEPVTTADPHLEPAIAPTPYPESPRLGLPSGAAPAYRTEPRAWRVPHHEAP
ncbi:ATP-binding protein [Streptomyces sp. RY43-2]|uniref:histidine kinase n=1 Tax=Streptomyces macrolidinus TaxID=2952607 RepID=A0ABT0ZDI3_9ACTN|nr:ATP-binding protein [Streptomyces macrolidinus]MCN9241650.1 ATP-binding protein [Streptomyces macrolidinus]